MMPDFDTAAIRRFLMQFFDDPELTALCFDYFPQVYNEFTVGMEKGQKALLLVGSCRRQGRLPDLLAALERERPSLYPQHLASIPHPEPAPPEPVQRNPRQVFISHAQQDADFTRRLAADLQARGWPVWLAPDSIRPGEKWVEAINRGLAESGVFALVLTPAAVRSRWVQSETNVAIGMEHRGELRFLPLDVQLASPPPLWQAYQFIPFRDSYQAGLQALLMQLQPEMAGQLARLYTQLQQAVQTADWPGAQRVGGQIEALHPGYRDTRALLARAEQEHQRQQAQAENLAQLHRQLQTAESQQNWSQVQAVARRIQAIQPDDDGARQAAARATLALRQQRRLKQESPPQTPAEKTWPAPLLMWGGAGALFLIVLFLALRPDPSPQQPPATDTAAPPAATAVTPSLTATVNLNRPPDNAGLHDTWTRPADGMVMVFVPGGTFMMGSDLTQDADAQDDELPQHEVTLDSFWLDRTEVTNAQYWQCVARGECSRSSLADDSRYNGLDYPVVGVSWQDASNYCAWAGGRLPTEAEWEYAARGEAGYIYPWGNEFDGTRLNYCDTNCTYGWKDASQNDGYELTAPVGSYSPAGDSWVGAADMAGNVWEWVADWYSNRYYASSPSENPTGPESGDYRALRGGSWFYFRRITRAANRLNAPPDDRYDAVGFRCVLPPGR